jgi:hypothetical protein
MRTVILIALITINALLLASCSSLISDRKSEVPPPRTIAVLPFSGRGDVASRALVRNFAGARMAEEKVLVLDRAWVDQRLSEGGYLADPADFVFKQAEVASMCERLEVDGVLVGDLVEFASSDFLLFHTRSLDARLQLFLRDGRRVWMARHTVSKNGGLALESGQLLSAVQRELGFEASRERAAFAWRLVEEAFARSGGFDAGMVLHEEQPRIDSAHAMLSRGGSPAQERIVVEASGQPGASARFDLADQVQGVPMFEFAPGRYRGIFERRDQDGLDAEPAVSVEFVDHFGHKSVRGDVSWTG